MSDRLTAYRRPVLVMGLALAVRVLYDLELRASDPTFSQPMMDARWHFQWAMGIAQGDLWGKGVFFRAPLYPYFLGLILRLCGADFLVPRLIQAVLGAMTAGLVYALGERVGGRGVGMLAGVLAALYGPMVYFDGELLIETLYLPLVGGGLLLAVRALENDRLWTWSAAGLAMGLAAIARPNVLVLGPPLIAWIAWEKRRDCAAPALAWLLAASLPVLVVTLRNGLIGGEYVLVASQGGVNFYIGNNATADGKTAMTPTAGFRPAAYTGYFYRDSVDESSRQEAQESTGRQLSPGQVSSFWFAKAFAWIESHPRDWLKLTLRKAYFLANGYEIPSNRELYRVREWACVLGVLMTKDPIALPFGIIFPLAVAGIAFMTSTAARQTAPSVAAATHRLLLLYLVAYAATVVAFFVTARHRIPLVLALLPYASVAVLSFVDAVKRHQLDRVTLASIALLVAFFFLSNSRLYGVREDVATEFHLGLGEVYARQGRPADAIREFQQAVRVAPGMERAWFNLGVAYLEMKRYDDAVAALHRALELNAAFAPAWSHIGNAYLDRGMADDAAAYYRKALELDPSLAVAHYNLALVLGRKGDFAGYVKELEATLRSDPYFVPADLDLARVYVGNGMPEVARALLDRVMQVDPNNRRAQEYMEALRK
jgi:tetratricopeptide (TPR) repeat protein